MDDFRVFNGDCLEGLRELPDGAAQTCVTSPPYFGLRDYGHDGQIGLEESPADYVDKLVAVFREVRRALADDGTVWLNLGDSYSRSPKKGGSGPNGKNEHRWNYAGAQRPDIRTGGLAEKQLLGIPWRVAFALQDDGWFLRQDIIWHKPNPMPESVRDRCTKSHEYIFLLSKSPRYYFDAESISEPGTNRRPGNHASNKHIAVSETDPRARTKANLHKIGPVDRRNRRSVWTVSTKAFAGAHFAVFPIALIEPCVIAGSAPGDLVIDPFAGSGTTGMAAGTHGRRFYGCELNPEYAEMATERIRAAYAQGRLFA